jgi:hypothetical protein
MLGMMLELTKTGYMLEETAQSLEKRFGKTRKPPEPNQIDSVSFSGVARLPGGIARRVDIKVRSPRLHLLRGARLLCRPVPTSLRAGVDRCTCASIWVQR